MDKIKELQSMIDESNNIVVFTGAGISTGSGLKDFRSKDGLYKKESPYPAEYMLSNACFYTHPEEFFEYYKENFNCLDVEPNIAHKYLKKLEDKHKLKAIVTQNIDGLHTKAGNKNVYEVHGTIYKNHCIKCHKEYDANYIFNNKGIPKCSCGGTIKPDVVLYGELLPNKALNESINAISKCDMLIVCGSSLTVYPASGFIDYFKGKSLVIINKMKTQYDTRANLIINDDISKVFSKLK